MNGHVDIERTLDVWFVDGPMTMPDRLFDAVLDQVERVPQRRLARLQTRLTEMNPRIRLFTLLAAALLIVIAALAVMSGGSQGLVHATPSPSPVASSTPGVSSGPTLEPVSMSGQMAFSRSVDGNVDLYLMNLDRTGLVRLTTDPAEDLFASWSPDGRTMLFTRRTSPEPDERSELFALDIESGVERQLTHLDGGVGGASFSPAGDRILFDHWPVDAGFSVMDPDGSNRRLVASVTTDQDWLMGWSADGRSFYVLHADESIYRIDVATGERSEVLPGGTSHRNAAFSPDGTRLAYVGREPGTIWVATADGSEPRNLGIGREAGYLGWSPDGKYLLYRATNGMLHIVRPDGTDDVEWTEGLGPGWRPAP